MAKKETALARAAARGYWRDGDARVVIEAWQRSGMPLVAFAESHEIQPRRLARWVERLRPVPAQTVGFHEVRLVKARRSDAQSGERLEVILCDGCTVRVPRGFAPEDLRQVLEGRV